MCVLHQSINQINTSDWLMSLMCIIILMYRHILSGKSEWWMKGKLEDGEMIDGGGERERQKGGDWEKNVLWGQ